MTAVGLAITLNRGEGGGEEWKECGGWKRRKRRRRRRSRGGGEGGGRQFEPSVGKMAGWEFNYVHNNNHVPPRRGVLGGT